MHIVRRLVSLGALALFATGLLPAAGAQAAGDLTATCQFTGSGTLVPPVKYVGGSGSFTFSGPANCAGRDGGTAVVLEGLTLSASGSYFATVCGTGTTGPVTATLKQGANVIGTATITLAFAAGNGVIDPTSATFAGGPSNATNDANLGGGTVVLTDDKAGPVAAPTVNVGPPTTVNLNNNGVVTGYVAILPSTSNQPQVPDPSKPGFGDCVTQITVAGAFAVDTTL